MSTTKWRSPLSGAHVLLLPIAGNFLGRWVIFSWISIINHIRGEKFVVSESIIANQAIMSKLVDKKFVVLY